MRRWIKVFLRAIGFGSLVSMSLVMSVTFVNIIAFGSVIVSEPNPLIVLVETFLCFYGVGFASKLIIEFVRETEPLR